MAAPVREARPLYRHEFDQLVEMGAFRGERLELLEGALVTMSPVGAPHSSSIQELTELLVLALHGLAKVRVQLPFAADELSEPQPDLAIVPLGKYDTNHPNVALLLIEVSDSSLDKDRGTKSRIYAQCGVPEYWIVNVVERRVEVYTRPTSSGYEQSVSFGPEATIAIQAFPEVKIRIADLIKPAP